MDGMSLRVGIGFAILQALSTQSPEDIYLLGCRNEQSGNKAIDELRKTGFQGHVSVLQLDVTSDQSIKTAVEQVDARHGHLDGKHFLIHG